MKTVPKKRIDIVIEAPALDRLLTLLEESKVSGYTVHRAISGRGQEGGWSGRGLVGESGRMICVFSVLDGSLVDDVLEAVYPLVERQMAIVTVTDVQVVRGERF